MCDRLWWRLGIEGPFKGEVKPSHRYCKEALSSLRAFGIHVRASEVQCSGVGVTLGPILGISAVAWDVVEA